MTDKFSCSKTDTDSMQKKKTKNKKREVLRNVTCPPARQQLEHKFTVDLKAYETELRGVFLWFFKAVISGKMLCHSVTLKSVVS